MENKFKVVGRLWNNSDFEIISNGDAFYVLNNDKWNGEDYSNCWKVVDSKGLKKVNLESTFTIKPISKEINEDEFEIIDYEISEE